MRLPLALCALLFACSPGERIAGSKGGSETTNGVTACIHRGDGTPAAGSIVRLRRADYVRRPAALVKTAVTVAAVVDSSDIATDSQGRFFITNITPGNYRIEVSDTVTAAGQGGALLFTCAIKAFDTADLGTDSLRPYSTLKGHIDTENIGGRQLYAQVRGLERLARVNTDGSFAFYDLPGGNLDIRIVGGSADSAAREIFNVTIHSCDTTTVDISGTSAYSGYIYINTTAAGAPVFGIITGFPLLVRLDSSSFNFSQAQGNGADIRFTKANGAPLPYEIEQWDTVSKNASLWVRIDTIFGIGGDQRILMKWGDPGAAHQSNGQAVFDTAQGFAGVWHLNEKPESGADAIKDRTANDFSGTAHGSMTGDNVAGGMIGGAFRLDGNDDYIAVGPLNLSGSYTLSCWINADDLGCARRFIWKEFSYTLWWDAIAQCVRIEHFTDSLVWRGIYQDNFRLVPLNSATWYYLTATFDGDKIRLYIDGELKDSTQTIGDKPHVSQQPLSIGGRSGEYVKGVMDEVRIENRARSSDWIRLCYANQCTRSIVANFKR